MSTLVEAFSKVCEKSCRMLNQLPLTHIAVAAASESHHSLLHCMSWKAEHVLLLLLANDKICEALSRVKLCSGGLSNFLSLPITPRMFFFAKRKNNNLSRYPAAIYVLSLCLLCITILLFVLLPLSQFYILFCIRCITILLNVFAAAIRILQSLCLLSITIQHCLCLLSIKILHSFCLLSIPILYSLCLLSIIILHCLCFLCISLCVWFFSSFLFCFSVKLSSSRHALFTSKVHLQIESSKASAPQGFSSSGCQSEVLQSFKCLGEF
jgi:hypothetical protein